MTSCNQSDKLVMLPFSLRHSLAVSLNPSFTIPNRWCLSLLFCFLFLPSVRSGPHERRLLNDLLKNYQILERPVANESEPLAVKFGMTLQQIIDVDEKNQLVITNLWLRMDWIDANLVWDPSDYGGITGLRISPEKIWRPDILMYNSADEKFDGTFHTNVVVLHNGSCNYQPPGIFKSTCKIDITWFPFDDQSCQLKFGSWTYQSEAVDLQLYNSSGDTSTYIPSGEWVLLSLPGQRNTIKYDCCLDTYIDITFNINLRRRTLYYGFNLIVPSVIISSMTLLSFTLPPDSGEKLTLGVTILLSMIVFLMQLAEIMPATSDSVSIIGSYFACIMIMVAFSVVMTVVVLNFHHRTTEKQKEMPNWIRKLILTWLPVILRMKKPPELQESHRAQTQLSRQQTYCVHNLRQSHDPMQRPWDTRMFNLEAPSSPSIYDLQELSQKMSELQTLCLDKGCSQLAGSTPCPGSRTHVHNSSSSNPLNCFYHAQSLDVNHQLARGNGFASQGAGLEMNHIDADRCAYRSYPPPAHRHNQHHDDNQRYLVNLLEEEANLRFTFDRAAERQEPLEKPIPASGGCHCCELNNAHIKELINHDCYEKLMQELFFLTNRIRREDDLSDIIAEWKFAAIVIDRACLIVFSTFAVLSLAGCLSYAPHLIV